MDDLAALHGCFKINIGITIPKGTERHTLIGIRFETSPLDTNETNTYRTGEIDGHYIQIAASFNQSNNFVDAVQKKPQKCKNHNFTKKNS